MRLGCKDVFIRIASSETEPGCYGWTILAADGRQRASAPYASATAEAARLSAGCWRRELDGRPAALAPLRVLIAEDNAFYAEALRRLLAREGYAIVGVADCADEAMAIAWAERPDLALVDLTLRDGFSGPELGRRLVKGGVGVLFLTATPDLAPVDVLGVLGVLAKPAGDARLLHALAEARAGGGAALSLEASARVRKGTEPCKARRAVAGLALAAALALMALTAWSIERAPVQAYGAVEGQAEGI